MKLNTNEKFSADLKRNLLIHQPMLRDGMRNKLIYQALKEHVSAKTKFLDIGAGTGVWAILAAKLGAKRVIAVEIEEALIPIIYQHAKENGVADKIEIIQANINDFNINEKFDVIFSEIFGTDAFGKKTIDSFIKFRNKFLAKDGTLIPQKMIQYAVPINFNHSLDDICENIPFESNFFEAISLNYNQNISLENRDKIKFVAEPKKLLEVDFQTIAKAPNLQNLTQTWKIKNSSNVNAFAVYNHSYYTQDIQLNLFDSSSWVVGVYKFKPFKESFNEIKFDVTFKNQQYHWKISSPSNQNIKAQIYSPGFAVARLKMALATASFQKF